MSRVTKAQLTEQLSALRAENEELRAELCEFRHDKAQTERLGQAPGEVGERVLLNAVHQAALEIRDFRARRNYVAQEAKRLSKRLGRSVRVDFGRSVLS